MSSFNNNGVTQKGASIIAAAIAGDTLTFTRIIVGDGVLPSGQTVLTTESLVNPLFDVPISSVESDGGNIATVKGAFSNDALTVGFFYREIGLYAIDPVTNSEVLYCYGNAGDTAEWINPVGESSLVEKEIHLVTLVGNATTVTAVFEQNSFALQSEMNAKLPLKADLDGIGGRVLASQMRFDDTQSLYVDISAAAGGDGSASKPFKTIQQAVNARYRGAANAIINIAPGDYGESISISNIAGLAWTFQRNGTGTVKLKSLALGACSHVGITNLTFEPVSSFGVSLNNVASAYLTGITINGNKASNGFALGHSRAVIFQCTINNTNIAVATGNNSNVSMAYIAGTGNSMVASADASVISATGNTIVGTVKYDKLNGGVVYAEGGESSYPSNYSQLYRLGIFNTADEIKASILAEFDKLAVNECRICSFDAKVAFGPFIGDQRIRCDITKLNVDGNNPGSGVVMLYSFHPTATTAIMQITDGTLITEEPVAIVNEMMVANTASYGVMRTAAPSDELDCTVSDAALTPANIHAMANYRIASTKYTLGDIVGVPYHAELVMKCTKAGKTSAEVLDTTSAKAGDIITDNTVTWTVMPNAIINATIGGKVITLTFSDGSTKTLTTQDTAPYTASATAIGGATKKTPAVVVESYQSGANWYRVWSDGWIEQGGATSGSGYNTQTITFPKAFSDTNYIITFNGSGSNKTADGTNYFNNKTATSISLSVHANGLWYACGT